MSREVAFAAVDMAIQDKSPTGMLFYGGEPMLERQLIYDVVEYTKSFKHKFSYKITTNGTLLDEEFLQFARDINMSIGFSHDGPSQDICRTFLDGGESSSVLDDKIALVLKYIPYAIGMSVIDPSTVHNAAGTAEYLFKRGFRYISLNLNYGGKWTQENFNILKYEYEKMAELYIKWTRAEEKFYLSPFDSKIFAHIKGKNYNADRRRMAKNQPSIGPCGGVFTGSRSIKDDTFRIGDVFAGIDRAKQDFIFAQGEPPEPCQNCALLQRCNYAYDSMDSRNGQIINGILSAQCIHEQLITPIADHVAETLYSENNALFIHKHYNEAYPLASLMEDRDV